MTEQDTAEMFAEDTTAGRILLAGAERGSDEPLAARLAKRGWTVEEARTAEEAVRRLQDAPFDAVVLGFHTGGEWLARARMLRPEARVILIGDESGPRPAMQALRERAYSYFSRPFSAAAVVEMAALALSTQAWEDDIELISGLPNWLTLRVRGKMETADRLMQFLREVAADVPPTTREDVSSALRELVLNGIEHGAGADPQKRIQISLVRTARALICHIQDPGPGFHMDAIRHAAVSNPPDQPVRHVEIRAEQGFRPGGFGILLTRNLVDELLYNEKGNEVLFVKYLEKGGREGKDVPGEEL